MALFKEFQYVYIFKKKYDLSFQNYQSFLIIKFFHKILYWIFFSNVRKCCKTLSWRTWSTLYIFHYFSFRKPYDCVGTKSLYVGINILLLYPLFFFTKQVNSFFKAAKWFYTFCVSDKKVRCAVTFFIQYSFSRLKQNYFSDFIFNF